MKLLRQMIRNFLVTTNLKGPIQLLTHQNSALQNAGWFKSHNAIQSIDQEGKPIPWCAYSFIYFIDARLKRDFRVFEYGSGHSTLWYAKKVKEIIAVEHDDVWQAKVSSELPTNARVIFRQLENGYTSEISHHGTFDIVIVDGRRRAECAHSILTALKPDGIIVWDDSDRSDFLDCKEIFTNHHFREIQFKGLAPIGVNFRQTSILYRSDNCLGI